MPAKLIIRVSPDDRIQVKVEGLAATDAAKPKGKKLCEKITRRLEEDLGLVEHREYETDLQEAELLVDADRLMLGDC